MLVCVSLLHFLRTHKPKFKIYITKKANDAYFEGSLYYERLGSFNAEYFDALLIAALTEIFRTNAFSILDTKLDEKTKTLRFHGYLDDDIPAGARDATPYCGEILYEEIDATYRVSVKLNIDVQS